MEVRTIFGLGAIQINRQGLCPDKKCAFPYIPGSGLTYTTRVTRA